MSLENDLLKIGEAELFMKGYGEHMYKPKGICLLSENGTQTPLHYSGIVFLPNEKNEKKPYLAVSTQRVEIKVNNKIMSYIIPEKMIPLSNIKEFKKLRIR